MRSRYGPAPAVRAALAEYPFLDIYPDPEQRELRAALAEYTGVPDKIILPGQGADELIDLICRLTLGVGDAMLNCPPTFGMYPFDAALTGAEVISVPCRDDFRVDVRGVEEASRRNAPKLIFLTSPNNPDGSLLPKKISYGSCSCRYSSSSMRPILSLQGSNTRCPAG